MLLAATAKQRNYIYTYRLLHQPPDSLRFENQFLHIKGFINHLKRVMKEFYKSS